MGLGQSMLYKAQPRQWPLALVTKSGSNPPTWVTANTQGRDGLRPMRFVFTTVVMRKVKRMYKSQKSSRTGRAKIAVIIQTWRTSRQ